MARITEAETTLIQGQDTGSLVMLAVTGIANSQTVDLLFEDDRGRRYTLGSFVGDGVSSLYSTQQNYLGGKLILVAGGTQAQLENLDYYFGVR